MLAIKAAATMGVACRGNAIHPGIVLEHAIDDPAADEGNHPYQASRRVSGC
jgi:F0F1-type ATP synthase membrane subunit c/vacuolar-type H+-ATPase subunit K